MLGYVVAEKEKVVMLALCRKIRGKKEIREIKAQRVKLDERY